MSTDPRLNKAAALARVQPLAAEAGERECASITGLAAAEEFDRSYLFRLLRLTLLAPEMVEAIVDGRQPEG